MSTNTNNTTSTVVDKNSVDYQHCFVENPLVSESSKPIIELLILAKMKENGVKMETPTSLDTCVTDRVTEKDSEGKDVQVCTCSHCCDKWVGTKVPLPSSSSSSSSTKEEKEGKEEKKKKEKKYLKGYLRLQEVSREPTAKELNKKYGDNYFKDPKCIYCQKDTSKATFALFGGGVSWCQANICAQCVKSDLMPRYRLNHCILCQVCNTNSISVCGNGGYSRFVWEAFACKCEKVRHLVYNTTGPYVDSQIHGRHGLYQFHGDGRCVSKKVEEIKRFYY
jgi:hypothetical protein